MKKRGPTKSKQVVAKPSFFNQIWHFIKQSFTFLWDSIEKRISRWTGATNKKPEQKHPQPLPTLQVLPSLEEAKKAAEQEGKNARRLTHTVYPYLDPGWQQLGLAISRAEYIMQKDCMLEEVEEIRQTLFNKMVDFKGLVEKKHLIKQKAEVSLAQVKKFISKHPNQEIAPNVLEYQKKIEHAIDIKNYPKIESDTLLKELESDIGSLSSMIEEIMSKERSPKPSRS
jgi:hypothetical protein